MLFPLTMAVGTGAAGEIGVGVFVTGASGAGEDKAGWGGPYLGGATGVEPGSGF